MAGGDDQGAGGGGDSGDSGDALTGGVGPDAAGPAHHGLCTAWSHVQHSPGKAAQSTAFRNVRQVDCSDVATKEKGDEGKSSKGSKSSKDKATKDKSSKGSSSKGRSGAHANH